LKGITGEKYPIEIWTENCDLGQDNEIKLCDLGKDNEIKLSMLSNGSVAMDRPEDSGIVRSSEIG
jgi:hypothetical protein